MNIEASILPLHFLVKGGVVGAMIGVHIRRLRVLDMYGVK
jgi:hypothetical protein